MTTVEFVTYLQGLGLKLWSDGERLRCRGPAEALTSELQWEIKKQKAEILAYLRAAECSTQSEEQPFHRVSRGGHLPLSFAQQRLWFLSQLEPDSPVYNEPKVLRFRGRLGVEWLQKTLDTILERHEVLRTTFVSVDGKPAQVIHTGGKLDLTSIDLTGFPNDQQAEEIHQVLSELTHRPFDLDKDWPIRTVLIRLGGEDHLLLIVTHHIASDGWSGNILFRELSELYDAYSQEKTNPLKDLPIQYADYAVWQREWMQGDVQEGQLIYWRKQLDGARPLELPTDRPRPSVQSHAGRSLTFTIPQLLAQEVKQFSRREKVTLFMSLLAAFQTLLQRYTGQDDIVLGSLIAGRNRKAVEGLIGFFVNTLVLRNDLSGNPTFREVLARVKETALDAYCQQDIPFEKLVEELQPQRKMTRNPFFEVMFQLRNNPPRSISLRDLKIEEYGFVSDIAKFDLSVALRDDVAGLSGSVEYRTDLFDAATIERMIGHFQTLLEGIVANPDQRISDLPLLTEAEKHRLLVEWNDTKTDYPNDQCIHRLFEEQVEKTPEAIALVFEDQQLTYRELNNRANRLAHYLTTEGVQSETPVAIYLDRSIELAVALLAVLKAGGVYVPIDPSYPSDRVTFILQDVQAPFVVSTQALVSQLSLIGARTITLDTELQKLDRHDYPNPRMIVGSQSPSYILYTSGSTGTPKGVVMSHGALNNLISWQVTNFGRSLPKRTLQFAPLGFDVSIQEMLSTWCSGGSLYLIRNDLRQDGLCLMKFIEKHSIERIFLPFVALQHFAEVAVTENCTPQSLREIITAGEQLRLTKPLRLFLDRLGVCRLTNQYGPTESHVVTEYTLNPPFRHEPDLPPIGRPIANTEIYILDPHLNPVPIGVAGELLIGGVGVAQGYFNRAELTQEKFIANPFSTNPGARLYKTGDLARYLPDGNTEFLGRIDNQVKIRGFRIELGEIEFVLTQHPAIQQAVVLAREDSPGDRRLVAYSVATEGSAPTAHELRSHLQQKLPDYMVPSAYVFLDSLPLTPNGKLDRKALPAPDQTRPELDETFAAPRTPVEEILANIWAEVLKLDTVGIHDNFFNLGGHSLLATQVISRTNLTLQANLPLRALFMTPTVAGLAEQIATVAKEESSETPLPIHVIARDKPIPLSFAQQRLWILDRLEPNQSAYNMPAAFRLTGRLDIAALEQSIDEIVKRHETLRTTISVVGDEPVQSIAPSLSINIPIIDLTQVPKDDQLRQVQQRAHWEAKKPFDLSLGPLMRVTLLRIGKEEHILLLTLHHIVSDGWSMGVLYRELSVLYAAFANGRSPSLPELAIQYADYAVWQRQWLQSKQLLVQLDYWKQQLDGAPRVLDLPTDYPRPATLVHKGSKEQLLLSADLSEKVRSLSRLENTTVFMTLLAAFSILLHRYTGEDEVVVGTPIAGRNRSEIEGVIGCFLNHLALRIDVSANPSFTTLLTRVREIALGAYSHQDVPFEKLLEELRPERDMSRTPIFQAYINMLNLDDVKLELPGVTSESIGLSEPESKFDLTLYIRDDKTNIHFNLVYNTSLYDRPRMAGFLRQLERILSQVVDDPALPVARMTLVTSDSALKLPNPHRALNNDWHGPINDRLSLCARNRPNSLALVDQWGKWDYKTLDSNSNRIAHYLRAGGIQREDIVAVYAHRSASLVCVVFGILKAGAAFLILDPAYPDSRLLDCLEQAQPHAWLQLEGAGCLPDGLRMFSDGVPSARRMVVPRTNETLSEALHDYSSENPRVQIEPDDLAYISFTSGSTGRPKGVLGRHGPLTHFLPWQKQTSNINHADHFSLLSGLSHDPLQRDIFTAVWVGASIHIPNSDLIGTSKLASWMAEEAVSFAHFTPPMLKLLVETAAPGQRIPSLRYAFMVGDSLTRSHVKQLYSLAPHATCISSYGATETQRAVGYDIIGNGAEFPGRSSKPEYPLGTGIEDVQLLVLNSEKQLAGIGEYGEIYVRSPHLARGYLNDANLTSSKFLINPYTNNQIDRLYKTGDMGRYLPDGKVEFAGRVDQQVKIRGFRVELAEIESVLNQLPSVKTCAVITHKDIHDDQHIIAYIAATPGCATSPDEFRRALQAKLPAHMIPSAFIPLEKLPLTPNGKLDRKALPAPGHSRPEIDDAFAAPRTPIEETLANIWSEVLKLDKVGIHDNFFALGGHSLLATQIVSRIQSAFSIELPLRQMFESPTVAEMALIIIENKAKWASVAEFAQMLAEVEALTDEEVQTPPAIGYDS